MNTCTIPYFSLMTFIWHFPLVGLFHAYFNSTDLEPRVAPIPGPECLTILIVMEYSPSRLPSICGVTMKSTQSFPLYTWNLLSSISGIITISRRCVFIGFLGSVLRSFSMNFLIFTAILFMLLRNLVGINFMNCSRLSLLTSSISMPLNVNFFAISCHHDLISWTRPSPRSSPASCRPCLLPCGQHNVRAACRASSSRTCQSSCPHADGRMRSLQCRALLASTCCGCATCNLQSPRASWAFPSFRPLRQRQASPCNPCQGSLPSLMQA